MIFNEINQAIQNNAIAMFSAKSPIVRIEYEQIMPIVRQWESICLSALSDVRKCLTELINAESRTYFSRFAHTELQNEARYIIIERSELI